METAKLGPLAFYKVPGWGCMGWGRLAQARSRGCGPEQSWGRGPSRLSCGSPAASCIRPLSAQPRLGPEVLQALASMGLSLGPGTTAVALLHPSSSQTAVQVPALMCGAQGLAHGAETCVHCGGHDVAAPALQSTICVRPVLTHTCSPVLLPGLGCWDNQWQAHTDFPSSCCPLPGLRSCCCPARSSDHSHLSLPGAAAQTFWDQSDHLSQRDQTLPCPGGGGERVGHPQDPRTPLCSLGPVPFPLLSTPLLCLATTCGQPRRKLVSPLTPILSISTSALLLLGVFVGFFFCLPTALLALSSVLVPPSALSLLCPRSRTVLSQGVGDQMPGSVPHHRAHGAGGAAEPVAVGLGLGAVCVRPCPSAFSPRAPP